MKTYKCRECGKAGQFEPITVPGFEYLNEKPRLCDSCADAQEARLADEVAKKNNRRLEEDWDRIMPPAYRMTDPSHPSINRAVLAHLMSWRNRRDGMGIALIGDTGICKTRMMSLLAKKLHFEGVFVEFINSMDLGEAWQRSFGDDAQADNARTKIRRCRNCEVLFLDDVGKWKMTERVEAEFYGLIEHRTSNLKPVHWTANSDGTTLKSMMSADRGGAIVRRLSDFSEAPNL